MSRARASLVVAVALVAAAAFAPGTATAGSKRTVTIGVIAPIDGGLTSFGRGIRNSVELAVRHANEDDRIPGWTIEVRTVDDSSDTAKGVAAARTLKKDKSVVAIVGPYNSGVAEALLPELGGKVALVSPSNTLTSLTQGTNADRRKRPYDNYFRMVGADSLQAEFLAQQARRLGFTKAAVVSETKAVSKGLADRFATAFQRGGGTVTVRQLVADGATDFTGFIDAARPTAPDLVFFGGEYQVAATLRTQSAASGLIAPVMGGDGMNDPAYIADAGAAAAGSYASGVGTPIAGQPGGAPFSADYRAAGFGDAPTDYGPYAYDATNVIIKALKAQLKGKSSIPANTRARVISRIQHTDLSGVTGTIGFDEYGDETDPAFTLYRVTGSPLAWAPVAQ
jgi:branched-chain amino acid transport system substrate-binding protein